VPRTRLEFMAAMDNHDRLRMDLSAVTTSAAISTSDDGLSAMIADQAHRAKCRIMAGRAARHLPGAPRRVVIYAAAS